MALTTQREIDGLATRIRHAYHARGMQWNEGCSTMRVWTAAALVLVQLHGDDPSIPMDPELFVASQSLNPEFADVWSDLTSEAAGEAYRKRIREIVRLLERELKREIAHAERLIESGRSIDDVLHNRDARLSSLGRYLVASRAARPSLAAEFEDGVAVQHRSCPMYRSASLAFLPAELYPVAESQPKVDLKASLVARPMIASLN